LYTKLGNIAVPILTYPGFMDLISDLNPTSPIWEHVKLFINHYHSETPPFPTYVKEGHKQTWAVDASTFSFDQEAIKYINNSPLPVALRFEGLQLAMWPKVIEFLGFNSPNLWYVNLRFAAEDKLPEEYVMMLVNLIPHLDHLRVLVLTKAKLLEKEVFQIMAAVSQNHSLIIVNFISNLVDANDWSDTVPFVEDLLLDNVTLSAALFGTGPEHFETSLPSLVDRIMRKNLCSFNG
jgi:hypothetical protein